MSYQATKQGLTGLPNRNIWASKSWIDRWWTPDPRRAAREISSNLTANFWSGAGLMSPRAIRDISNSGFFLLTEERWYPGTVIRMTLTKSYGPEQRTRQSLCVQSRAVRSDMNGVGLQFVMQDTQHLHRGETLLIDGADKRNLEDFLNQIKDPVFHSEQEERDLKERYRQH